MKAVLVISIIIFYARSLNAQNVNFKWAKQMGESAGSYETIAVDNLGNVYVTGSFLGTIDFDPGPSVYNLTSNGSFDIFIMKLDAAGNLVWAKSTGGAGEDQSLAIAIDANNNVYLTGYFSGTADFDPGPGLYNLTSITMGDFFVWKLDTNGNLIWAKQFGARAVDCSNFLALDTNGNIYLNGNFYGTADFDPGPNIYNLTSRGIQDIFVSKLDSLGNFLWAKQITVFGYVFGIAVDTNGNVFTTGGFSYTGDFDPGPGAYNLSSAGNYDSFILKLDALGNFAWAKRFGSVDVDEGISITVDVHGNIFTTGVFNGTVDFDPGAGTHNLISSVNYNNYILKLDASGNFMWVKQLGGELIQDVVTDQNGNLYSTGAFTGTVDFDPGTGIHSLSSNGLADIDILKLDAFGNFVWANQMGGEGYDGGVSIAVDASGNVYTAGEFINTVDFDPSSCTFILSSTGIANSFVQKLGPCINGTNSITAVACGSFTLNNKTFTATGVYTQSIPGVSCCDSIITINLTIKPVSFSIINATVCSGQSYAGYTTSGMYIDTLIAANGCDSIRTINLTVKLRSLINIDKMICSGQTYLGHSTSGIYTDTLIAANGCDSIRTINLIVNKSLSSIISQSICQGQTYSGHNATGVYTDTLIAADGCDSIQTLHLTVFPIYTSTIDTSICYGQNFEGYNTSGVYKRMFRTINGCDSVQTIQLTVLPSLKPFLGNDTSICKGDSLMLYPGPFNSYTWQDGSTQSHITVKRPGLYSVEVSNSCGSARDEIKITDRICGVYFPSAFTPNNDGKNNVFKVLGGYNLHNYHLAVYNRWGQQVFETNDYTQGWSGNFNGRSQGTGLYVWYCSFRYPSDLQNKEMKGTVLLIR